MTVKIANYFSIGVKSMIIFFRNNAKQVFLNHSCYVETHFNRRDSLSPPRRIRREPLSQYLFTTLRISAVNFLCVLCGYFFCVTSVNQLLAGSGSNIIDFSDVLFAPG